MKCLKGLALILIIIGALNWGLWGFFQFDLVAWLCNGNTNMLARLIYSIIGLAGVLGISFLGKCRLLCCGSVCCSKCGKPGCCAHCGKSADKCSCR